MLSPWRIAMPEEDYDELYHLTDNPDFSGPDPHHAPSTISEEEAPGIYLTNDPHSHVGTNLDKPYIATFRVPAGYEDHPAFEPDHYGKSGDYFVSPEWYEHIQFAGVSPNPAHKKGGSDRTAAVHDRLMQIVAMADTTPWHPHIIEDENAANLNHGRGRDKRYILPEIGKYSDTYPWSGSGDAPLAMLDFTLHDKGEKHWRLGEGLVPRQHNEAYINSIIVHPKHQGKGIAQALIERLNKDHPEYQINPGVTTPKGHGLVQQLKKLIPDSEEKISPNYKPYVMDDDESSEYEKSEYAHVGHEDYEYDDYTSEYSPRSRQLVNASYDDSPYWGAGWDDEDEDDEDDWPEGTVPKVKGHKHVESGIMDKVRSLAKGEPEEESELRPAPPREYPFPEPHTLPYRQLLREYQLHRDTDFIENHEYADQVGKEIDWRTENQSFAPRTEGAFPEKELVTARFWHAGKSGELPEGIQFSHGKMFDGRDAVQAHVGDDLIGQLQWDSRNPERGFDNDINYITVHPEYRRRGIGSAMYQHAVQNVDPHLLPGSLNVTPSGRGLSKSLGFKPKDQGTYYDGTPMKFNLNPVRDDGNDWPDAAVGNGWQWDEKFNHRSKDRFSRFWNAS